MILTPRSRSALLISICPMVQEIVGHPGSLYFIEMGPDRILLILVAKNTFLGTFVSLLRTHVLMKFDISWDLLDSVKKRHIQFDLIKHLKHLLYIHILIVVPKPLGKGAIGL